MQKRERRWVRGRALSAKERATIAAACERFIYGALKPRFLPEICPTEFNYPVDILGKWHGGKYRFIERFRSDRDEAGPFEFDAPFARIEYRGPDRFDVWWMRHTGTWWPLYRSVPLAEALRLIETDGILRPS